MTSLKTSSGLPPHQLWSFYLLLLVSLMAYNSWGCVTEGFENDFYLRLHGGTTLTSGFPQYKINNTWHRVCTIDWTAREAEAFCLSLRYLSFVEFRDDVTQAPDTNEAMFRTFASCTGNERCLDECENHKWQLVPHQSSTESPLEGSTVSECYLKPSREVACSTVPPVTPTNPVAPAFAIAEEPKTPPPPESDNAVAKSKFASLQSESASTSTTLSPLELLAETFKCLVDPDNCIFNVQSTAATTTAKTTAEVTTEPATTAKGAQALAVVENTTTAEPTTPSIPTVPTTPSTSTTIQTTAAETTVTNGTTPTTQPTTTPTLSTTTLPSTTTKLTTPRTPTTTTTEPPPQPMPANPTTSASSTSKTSAEDTTSDITTETSPTTPNTWVISTTKRMTTTKPVFTTPFTGSTTTVSSTVSTMSTPTTRAAVGSTGRPPIGVSPAGDNTECPDFANTYKKESATLVKITSPNYPSNYPANVRCKWLFRGNDGKVIRITVKDFKIQQYDFLRIYEFDANGKLVAELSGDIADPNRIPVSNTTRRRRDTREKRATQDYTYVVNSDQAYLDFYSDDAHTDRGFSSSLEETEPGSAPSTSEGGNKNWIWIVIVLLLLLLLIIALILFYCWWKNKKEKQNKCGFVIRDEKQLLYSKDGKMTVDPKSDYNAVAKSVESLFCVEGDDKAKLIDGYKDTIVVFDNPSYRTKNRSGSQASLEQKSDDIKHQMARSGLPDPPSRPGSGMRTPRPFVKDGVVMMLPKTNNYTPDESRPTTPAAPQSPDHNLLENTPHKKRLSLSKDSKVAPLDPEGSNVKSTITMNPRSEATTDPEGVICANNKYSIVATVDGKKFGELDPVGSIPPDFLCPITNKLMKNPVMGSDGKNYERKAIVAWLAKKQTSPVTDEPMTEDSLKPNAALKSRIKQWKKQKEVTKDRADREASASHTSAIGDIDC